MAFLHALKDKSFYLLAAIALVILLSGAAITWLHSHSSKEWERAVETDELSLLAFHLYTSTWRVVLASQDNPLIPADATAAERAESEAIYQSALARFQAELEEDRSLDVRADIESLMTLVTQAHDLAVSNEAPAEPPVESVDNPSAGPPVIQANGALDLLLSTHPIYYPLADRVYASSQEHADHAVQTRQIAYVGTIGIYVLTFVALNLLYRRYRAIQRVAEDANTEREVLRRSEARFRPLVQSSSDVIAVMNEAGALTYASPAIRVLAGIDPDHAVGQRVIDMIADDDRRAFESLVKDVKARAGFSSSIEVRILPNAVSPSPRDIQVVCTNRLHDPDVRGLVLNIRDISERKTLEEQLRQQAFYDSLTNLANRLRFMDRLDYALLRARRSGNEKISVIYMDLDHFKYVNDERGHSVGDALLKEVGARLVSCVRPSDTAARLGGDEFAVLLEDGRSADEAREVADRILEMMLKPFHVHDQDLFITASLGLVTVDAATMSTEEVIRNADVAMYDAKENGRSRVQVFNANMRGSLAERQRLVSQLGVAVEKDEFVVHYQPTLSLDSGEVMGFEALVRWNHPERGLLEPSEFISLAEETGVIHALGALILERACRQARVWQDTLPATSKMTMSVNLSAKQLVRPGFAESVRDVLEQTGLAPHRLILEVTESVLVPQPQQALDALENLKQLGIQVALDDFGTGYSSLSYLKRFPIDIIKIDRSFIDGIDNTDKDRMLVQTVIDLGTTLNLEVVAEGIERLEQAERLRTLHCDVGQGYLFSRPLAPEAVEAYLLKAGVDAAAWAADHAA